MIKKSQTTRTNKNPFEKSSSKHTEYFVRVVKNKKNEFLIGWGDFPIDKYDTREPITNLTGSENMICEFQKQYALYEIDYAVKTTVKR